MRQASKQASKQVSTAMATALAPLVAPIVGAARTHRARLTGAARGCVSPDGSTPPRACARGAACGAPACAQKKRTDMQGSEGSAERRVWSAAASEAVEEAPKGATGAVESSAASRSARRRRPCHRVHAITVSMSFHRACHAVCVCARASCMCMYTHALSMRMERERESEREETGEREERERRGEARARKHRQGKQPTSGASTSTTTASCSTTGLGPRCRVVRYCPSGCESELECARAC